MRMLKVVLHLFSLMTLSHLYANADSVKEPCYTKLSEVLGCFIQHPAGPAHLTRLSTLSEDKLRVEAYSFDSQTWPIEADADIPATVWKHKLVFYIPDQILHNTVLLYVGGGYNQDSEGKNEGFQEYKEQLDFRKIALRNQAVVVDLQAVPNQFLFMGGKYRREDQFLAYTYKKLMTDPMKNAYLAGHLPMAKAIVRAMDRIETVLEQERQVTKLRFLLAGASKRGWAVWLAALEDSRVEAIVPIVIDVLNTQKSMNHICQVYKGCPFAFKDYAEEKLTSQLTSQAFADLMKIEDPFNYLGSDYDPQYRERLGIPKLIINASGDDFFVPDSSQWYFKALPGAANYIRYLPNSLHYFRGNPISNATRSHSAINAAVDTYFGFILKQTALPKIQWSFAKDSIELSSSVKPQSIKLSTAFNKQRDFRFVNRHTTWHLKIKGLLSYILSDVCDTCYVEREIPVTCSTEGECKIQVPLTAASEETWRASFLEVHYQIGDQDFVVSTEVSVEFLAHHTHKEL